MLNQPLSGKNTINHVLLDHLWTHKYRF